MSRIPPDLFERVLELSLALANASQLDDDVLYAVHLRELREYYDEQMKSGRAHPFLTEALADFTESAAEAVLLYELAIEQSLGFPDEPKHTKGISLAGRLIELGRTEQAEAYLRDGRAEAMRLDDQEWVVEADELLRKLAS
jgi:hypothetical protein